MLKGQAKKDYQREYMSKKRSNKSEGDRSNKQPNSYPFITRHAIESVLDPAKRIKLEFICETLKQRNLLGEVRFGVGGPTLEVTAEMLEATR